MNTNLLKRARERNNAIDAAFEEEAPKRRKTQDSQDFVLDSQESTTKDEDQEMEEKKTPSVILNNLDGSTRSISSRDTRSKNWFFTWNNYPEDAPERLVAWKGLDKWMFQEETGENGTKHLQGVLIFKNQKKFSTVKNWDARINWSMARNLAACKNYCSKKETRTGNQWCKGFKLKADGTAVNERTTPLVVKDPMEGLDIYKWEQDILDTIAQPAHKRHVHWIWSDSGNTGKSTFCKHLCLKHGAIVLGGKFSDAQYAIAKMVNEQFKQPNIIVFDIPRSQGNKMSYVAIENIKNGCFFSSKYEAQMVMYDPPHIFCFANEYPCMEKLSKDRWKIVDIDEKKYDFSKPNGTVEDFVL